MAIGGIWIGSAVFLGVNFFPSCKDVDATRCRPYNRIGIGGQRLVLPKDVYGIVGILGYTDAFSYQTRIPPNEIKISPITVVFGFLKILSIILNIPTPTPQGVNEGG